MMKRVPPYIHFFPAAIVILGVVACIVSVSLSGLQGEFAGLLILISLATFLVGGVLGFLFGIPKLNKAYNPRDDYNRSTRYHPNTNLEDVSDWLTKIIIGVGLTQLTRIPGQLQSLADNVLSHVDCSRMNCEFARPLLVATILYFLIAGFIVGYFYTRLLLPNLFSMMEESRVKDAEIAIWRAGSRKHAEVGNTSPGTEAATARKLDSLSDKEREVLHRVRQHDDRLSAADTLDPDERAAVNVLVAKGILEWERGNDTREGAIVHVADKELLDELM